MPARIHQQISYLVMCLPLSQNLELVIIDRI